MVVVATALPTGGPDQGLRFCHGSTGVTGRTSIFENAAMGGAGPEIAGPWIGVSIAGGMGVSMAGGDWN